MLRVTIGAVRLFQTAQEMLIRYLSVHRVQNGLMIRAIAGCLLRLQDVFLDYRMSSYFAPAILSDSRLE